jgi:tetraacyldisaccharide-1-P 4'-kinase
VFILETAARALLDRTVTRRLEAPARVPIVAVGGATLGGSGKTPLAIACAEELAAAGARVALVGHAYRADPRRARVVSPDDPLDEVGDEALLAARAFARSGVHGGARVVVAPSRREAIAFAARDADVLVLDGIAQLTPVPAALSLLAVDPVFPWGAHAALPPRGSMRAPAAMLVGACDAIVPLGEGSPMAELRDLGRDVWESTVESRGLRVMKSPGTRCETSAGDDEYVDGVALMTWSVVRSLRVGLLTAVARPERIVDALARQRVVPSAVVSVRDHGPFDEAARSRVGEATRRSGVDLWLATPKCALHAARALTGLPVAVLERRVSLHPLLRRRLRGFVVGTRALVTSEVTTP